MDEKKKKGGWQFAIGLACGIILYKLIFDVIVPMFTQ